MQASWEGTRLWWYLKRAQEKPRLSMPPGGGLLRPPLSGFYTAFPREKLRQLRFLAWWIAGSRCTSAMVRSLLLIYWNRLAVTRRMASQRGANTPVFLERT